ncbi:hypothetical protein NC651_009789 [Populus alba x Populus x berolinensis]|nr:hypothetical protein NC651_009789 [Populus alba x Populus x berolinensis]
MLLDPIDSSEFFQIYLQLLVYHFLSSGPSCLPTAFPSSRASFLSVPASVAKTYAVQKKMRIWVVKSVKGILKS